MSAKLDELRSDIERFDRSSAHDVLLMLRIALSTPKLMFTLSRYTSIQWQAEETYHGTCRLSTPLQHRKIRYSYKTNLLINVIHDLYDPPITTFILGDLNFPNAKWSLSSTKTNSIDDRFIDAMSELGMTQFVQKSNHYIQNRTGQYPGSDFSNDMLSVQILDHLPPISTSDHHLIEFSIYTTTNNDDHHDDPPSACKLDCNHFGFDLNGQPIQLPVYNWSAADYDKINDHINSIDWHELFGFNFNVESIWTKFTSLIWPIIDLYVP